MIFALGAVLVATGALHLVGVAASHFLPEWVWVHEPFHALVETAGGLTGLAIACLLMLLERSGRGTSFNRSLAAGLVAMSALDLLHAAVHPGEAFVWLHSFATFAGGALFASCWMDGTELPSRRRIIHRSCAAMIAIGLISLVVPSIMPRMLSNGAFTSAAVFLNLGGGALMGLTALRLARSFLAKRNFEDLLFAAHCLLFGGAALMFESSKLWDFSWWWWHMLRLAAYAVALAFGVFSVHRLREETYLVQRQAAETEAKAGFLTHMSHEIRTPMTAILGYSQLLSDEEHAVDEKERTQALSIIQSSSRHLLALISDILDTTKLESGTMELERKELDLPAFLRDLDGIVKPLRLEKDLPFQMALENEVPLAIFTDELRLRQILLNVLRNAFKFTETGSVTLRVRCERALETLTIEVIDTGIGMTPEQLEKVGHFKAFTQGDGSMSRKFGGTGLGLCISDSLAKLLGGSLEAESELGKGSCFRLTIPTGPLVDRELVTSLGADFEAPAPPPPEEEPNLEERRILLVEDGLVNQRLIRLLLEKAGAKVEVAEDGVEALEVIEAGRIPELILMDMQMPRLDGYAATRKLRERGLELPIIALTAHAMAEDRGRCLDAGCSDYLTKPVDRKLLVRTCSEWLEKQTTSPVG